MMIKDIPVEQRPRERLIKYGVSFLSNQELLSIILKSGTRNKSVYDLSNEILDKLSGIDKLKDFEISFLTNIKGIGMAKACEVLSAIELGKRIYCDNNNLGNRIHSSKDVFLDMKYYLNNKKQEYFYCLYLNNKNQILERKLLFMGTVNKSIVHPREVFKYAYLTSASSIICVHNHPSGDITPSNEDIFLTKSLIEIGKVQSIPVLDHIIMSDSNYYSMADNMEMFYE